MIRALIVSVVLLVPLAERVAWAGDLELHPSDAEVLVRADVSSLDELTKQLASLNIANRFLLNVARSSVDAALGFSSASASAWRAHGLDSSRPISASLWLDNTALIDRYERLLRNDSWSQKRLGRQGFWKLRVVFPTTDKTALIALLRRLPLGLTWDRVGTRAKLVSERITVAVTTQKGFVIVDVLRPVFGPSLSRPAAKDVTKALDAKMAAGSFGATKRVGAGAMMDKSGALLWMRTSALETLGRAVRREFHVASVKGRPALRAQGPLVTHDDCRDLSRTATSVFGDLAIRLAPRSKGVDAEVVLGSDAKVLAAALPRKSHESSVRREGTSGWVSVWLAGLAGVRALPRSRSMTSWPRALLLGRQCAMHHSLTARLFAWPLLAGLFGDELAALGPRSKIAAESFSGFTMAVSSWDRNPLKLVAAVEGPLVNAAREPAKALLTKVFGAPKTAGDRTTWGRGRARPFVTKNRVGTTLGGARGQAWLEKPALPTPSWLVGDELAAAYVDGKRGIGGLAAWEPAFSLLEGLESIRLRVFLRGDQLVLGATFERK